MISRIVSVLQLIRSFAGGRLGIHNVIIEDSSAQRRRIPVCGNSDISRLAEVDLYAIFHVA